MCLVSLVKKPLGGIGQNSSVGFCVVLLKQVLRSKHVFCEAVNQSEKLNEQTPAAEFVLFTSFAIH